jgi:hypothetical protein
VPHLGHLLLPLAVAALATDDGGAPSPATDEHQAAIPASSFQIVAQDSGPVNYYSVVKEGELEMIRSVYRPPTPTAVLGAVIPEAARKTVKEFTWRWRVHQLPKDSNDCGPGFSDSGAAVFLFFKAGLKYKILKYVWATTGKVGSYCQSKRGWFLDRDTIVLKVGGPLDVWRTEVVDPRLAFARHFETKPEDVPDFEGVGLMTDGDQSNSVVESDYADFKVRW